MAVAITRTDDPASTGVSVNGSVGTYSSVSIGTASDDRIVYLAVGTEVASGTITSATIDSGGGAVAMKPLAQATFGNNSARGFWLNVPTGTTATFAITFGATPTTTNQHISVYRVTGAYLTVSSGAYTSTDMDATRPLRACFDSTGGSSTAFFINIPTDGGFIGAASCATNGTAKTWAGATEDLDSDIGSVFRWTTATSTTGANATITCTGGTNNEDGALTFAIFMPNNASFGDLKAIGGQHTQSITNPFQPQSAITLAVGDLVIVNTEEIVTGSTTGVTDNLGHTGTQLDNTGSTLNKTYYYIVTSAGDATISAACTGSANDAGIAVAVYAGPFATTPLDKNPACLADSAEPYTSDATGTLTQADELVVGYFAQANANASFDTPSPGNIDGQVAGSGTGAQLAFTSIVVSATTTLTMAIGGATANVNTISGVATFKKLTGSTGAASGAGSSSIVGAQIAAATASASGTGASSVVGAQIAAADASATGTGSSSVVGAQITEATASATGTGSSGVVGAQIAAADGSATGTGAASATGAQIAAAEGAASGAGSSNVQSESTAARVVVSWVELEAVEGAAASAAVANASGTGTASATGAAVAAATGAASGTGTASATGAQIAEATASASGSGSASAQSEQGAAVGSATGTGTASATGAQIAAADASASGTGTASASSEQGAAIGSASGTGAASAIGAQVAAATATATGTGAASATATVTAAAAASATGTGTVSGSSQSENEATASASGTGAASAAGAQIATATASAIGTGAADGTGTRVESGVASASGTGAASAEGSAETGIQDAVGNASGIGTAAAIGSFTARRITTSTWVARTWPSRPQADTPKRPKDDQPARPPTQIISRRKQG